MNAEYSNYDKLTQSGAITPILLDAPTRGIATHRAEFDKNAFFVKVINLPGVAEKERTSHKYFENFPFVPKLKHAFIGEQNKPDVLAYDLIPGTTLQEALTESKKSGKTFPLSILRVALSQTQQLRTALETKENVSLNDSWSTASPIREGTLLPDEDAKFAAAYEPIIENNRTASMIFPGFYLDRNPRNIMVSNEDVYQIDFGIIEKSSPVFDLVKLLRNGTNAILQPEVSFSSIKTHPEQAFDFASVTPAQEEDMLHFSYTRESHGEANFDAYLYFYHNAALHSHLKYLTNYSRKLGERRGNLEVLKASCFYHAGMALIESRKLQEMGQTTEKLLPWINKFIDLAEINALHVAN